MRFLRSLSKNFVLGIILVISLSLNLMMAASTTVFSAVSGLLGSVTGIDVPRVRPADEVAVLAADVEEQRRVNSELRKQSADSDARLRAELKEQSALNRKLRQEAADAQAKVLAERQVQRSLRDEIAEQAASMALARAEAERIKGTVLATSGRVALRTARTATRESTAVVGESIPYWGIAVIGAATSLELYDLCQTSIDMNTLTELYEPPVDGKKIELTVCGLRVPSRGEIWEAVKNSPEKAWTTAKEALPDLGTMPDFSLTDVDWGDLSEGIVDGAADMGGAVLDGAAELGDSIGEAAGTKWNELEAWWNE